MVSELKEKLAKINSKDINEKINELKAFKTLIDPLIEELKDLIEMSEKINKTLEKLQ